MTDHKDLRYGGSAEEYAGILDGPLEHTDEPLPSDLPEPPPLEEPIYVNMSIRMPLDVVERLRTLAGRAGQKYTLMAREWIELELAAAESGSPITRAEALRAQEAIRKVLGAADAA